jgi:hypothetical protein
MAREEAARLHPDSVGTAHILLGLIREGEGVAAAVLTNLNVDLEDIQQKIEETVKKGKAAAAAGPDLPYTSRAKKVLELAMTEARELNHSYVGTEHLLLGLLREEKGIAAQVLTDAGVNLEQSRAETLRLLGSDMPQASMPLRAHWWSATVSLMMWCTGKFSNRKQSISSFASLPKPWPRCSGAMSVPNQPPMLPGKNVPQNSSPIASPPSPSRSARRPAGPPWAAGTTHRRHGPRRRPPHRRPSGTCGAPWTTGMTRPPESSP